MRHKTPEGSNRMRTKKEPRPLGRIPRTTWPACKAEGCEKTAQGGSLGFCWAHYIAARRGVFDKETGARLQAPKRVRSYGVGARCLVPDCGSRPFSNSVCSLHYGRWKQGQDIGVTPPEYAREAQQYGPAAECIVYGCAKRPVNKWMCGKHAQQRIDGILDEHGQQVRPLQAWGRKHKDGPVLDPSGYLKVLAPPGYQGKTKDGRVLEHRLVMEQHLGRLLHGRGSPHYEIVHHKDGNITNNDISNLEVLSGVASSACRHPPGHAVSPEQVQLRLDALCINDPAAYAALLEKLKQ